MPRLVNARYHRGYTTLNHAIRLEKPHTSSASSSGTVHPLTPPLAPKLQQHPGMATGEQRRFIRHTTDVPLEVADRPGTAPAGRVLDISYGGLSFESDRCPRVGRVVTLRIPTVDPPFEGEGHVAWCRRENGRYLVGVQFLDAETAFRSRMVEQICSIEKYRKDVLQQEGRVLSSQEAAAEWVARFADRFPQSD